MLECIGAIADVEALRDMPDAGLPHRVCAPSISQHVDKAAGERAWIALRNSTTRNAFTYGFRGPAMSRYDNGKARGLRLQEGDGEAFGVAIPGCDAREAEHTGCVEFELHLIVRARAAELGADAEL